MSEFVPDDVFTDVDLGADFLDEPDVPAEPGYADTGTVTDVAVVSEAWFMELVVPSPAENVGGVAVDVVLPDPFKVATGAGATIIGGWMSRKAARIAKRARRSSA
jgi:hypothetical protein